MFDKGYYGERMQCKEYYCRRDRSGTDRGTTAKCAGQTVPNGVCLVKGLFLTFEHLTFIPGRANRLCYRVSTLISEYKSFI